ncbi:hypothetical protein EW146_g10311 [Bondarzewia mesenterica]|uniref:Uncharacterized protein n=1 Tax=Bondarzewia mesenterica TaxID=1095465 RepID=A0A4S4KYF9_9AGAM|nr:hypothetical protein EW146_g10311 [Bondarzewia mesenterica]
MGCWSTWASVSQVWSVTANSNTTEEMAVYGRAGKDRLPRFGNCRPVPKASVVRRPRAPHAHHRQRPTKVRPTDPYVHSSPVSHSPLLFHHHHVPSQTPRFATTAWTSQGPPIPPPHAMLPNPAIHPHLQQQQQQHPTSPVGPSIMSSYDSPGDLTNGHHVQMLGPHQTEELYKRSVTLVIWYQVSFSFRSWGFCAVAFRVFGVHARSCAVMYSCVCAGRSLMPDWGAQLGEALLGILHDPGDLDARLQP